MTKARDLANIISGGFTEADIPNLSASKITSGSLADARIPSLAASKITSGTFADARIAASNVSQHATSFDDNKIVNDISTLGLRVHTQENLNASNTNSQYVDVFQDTSGYTNGANTIRNASEFVSTGSTSDDSNCQFLINSDTGLTDQSSNSISITNTNVTVSTNQTKFGTNSFRFNGSAFLALADHSRWRYNPVNWTWECFIYLVSNTNAHDGLFGQNDSSNVKQNIFQFTGSPTNTLRHQSDGYGIEAYYGTINTGQWYHIANVANASAGTVDVYVDGVRRATTDGSNNNSINLSDSDVASVFWIGNRNYDGSTNHTIPDSYWDSIRISNTARYSGASFTPPTSRLQPTITTLNSTGNFTCPNITASASTSKMGAVITYTDQAGTNALNTDIVLQLSADGGSNYSTATMTALPDFATGIKMAKVNDLSVTAGTSLKYKISFANQASGSKEARIRGVSLQY
jgi:hypothetical protein